MKITVFTILLTHGSHYELNKDIYPFCMNSWSRLKPYFENYVFDTEGNHVEYECKIYNEDSIEYKEFKELIPWEFGKVSWEANAFRMYLLSHKPYHFWLDWDIYISHNINKLIFKVDEIFLGSAFTKVYNSNNLELFSYIFDLYKEGKICNITDGNIIRNLNLPRNLFTHNRQCLIHLSKFKRDRTDFIKCIDEVTDDNCDELLNEINNNSRIHYYCLGYPKMNLKNAPHKAVTFCCGDIDLYNFLNTLKDKFDKENEEKGIKL